LFVSLELEVEAKPFRGASSCTVVGDDFSAFLDDLEPLAATSHGAANLSGGWGDSAYVSLKFSPHGSLGHIECQILLREHDPIANFRVEGSLVVEPQNLADFAASLRQCLQDQRTSRVELNA